MTIGTPAEGSCGPVRAPEVHPVHGSPEVALPALATPGGGQLKARRPRCRLRCHVLTTVRTASRPVLAGAPREVKEMGVDSRPTLGVGPTSGKDSPMTELLTDRLILRHWRAEDREPFAALNDDPEVMVHFPTHLTRDQSDAMADRITTFLDEHGWGLWAVEVAETGEFVGFTGFPIPRFDAPFMPVVEIGWRFGGARGDGDASEAARASVAHGFEPLDLDEIVAMIVPHNPRSQAVATRLGMIRDETAHFDHPLVPEGSPGRRHRLYRFGPTIGRPS